MKRCFLVLVVPASLLAASPLAAQPAKGPSPASHPLAPPSLADSLTGDAKAAYDSGRQLFEVNDFVAALIKFSAAHDASKDPRLLWNMAACEGKLHAYAKAVALLRGYLAEGAGVLSPQDQGDAQDAIKAMEPLTSQVRLTVPESGAEVYVDDALVGQTPLEPFAVDIGPHKIRVHKPEFDDALYDVTTDGSEVRVTLAMHPIVHDGSVSVHAGASDTIAIDGTVVAVGTWNGPLREGGHTLRVVAKGKVPYQSEVLVVAGQAREIGVTLNPEPRGALLPTWAWVAGGVVLAGGLGTGAYFLFKPSSSYSGPVGNLGSGLVQASAPIRIGEGGSR